MDTNEQVDWTKLIPKFEGRCFSCGKKSVAELCPACSDNHDRERDRRLAHDGDPESR